VPRAARRQGLTPMCRGRSWIVIWHGDAPTEAACAEAEALGAGRFDGLCTARFARVLNGFAATVRRPLSPPTRGHFLCVRHPRAQAAGARARLPPPG
jgi:hypothetical protein